MYEPIVILADGVPTWQLTEKIPSYLSDMQMFQSKEEMWRRLAPRKSVSLKARQAKGAASDIDIIAKALNIGQTSIEVDEGIAEEIQEKLETDWSTVEGIKEEIEAAVVLMDGTLVNDECLANYNDFLTLYFFTQGEEREFKLTWTNIMNYVMVYMANLYALNDYIENRLPLNEVIFYDTGMEFEAIYRIRDKIAKVLTGGGLRLNAPPSLL